MPSTSSRITREKHLIVRGSVIILGGRRARGPNKTERERERERERESKWGTSCDGGAL